MNKKIYFPAILIIILITSCKSQPQIPPSQTPAIIRALTFTPNLTQTPSPAPTNIATISSTSVPNKNVLQNELIAYAWRSSINVVPAIGGGITPIIQVDTPQLYYSSPSWSPSGSDIVFASEGNGIPQSINLVNKDGSGFERLRNNITGLGEPAWSPDGENIAYVTIDGLFLMHTDGSGIRQLLKVQLPTELYFPAWSPDGKILAVTVNSKRSFYGPNKIFLIANDGSGFRQITDAIVGTGHLSWSPDGKKIAFRSFEDCGDINILDLKTGNIINITNTQGVVETDPAWSADGNYIAYSKGFYTPCAQDQVYGYGGENIYIIQIDGKNENPVTTSGGNDPSWWPTVILRPNWKYSVTKAGSDLNIRESTSTSSKSLIKLKQGEVFKVLEGPKDAENYHWWRVRTEYGVEGWCVDIPGWYLLNSAE